MIGDSALRRLRQFLIIATNLNDSAVGEYTDSLVHAEDEFTRIQHRTLIDATGGWLAWVLTLWTLWRALWS